MVPGLDSSFCRPNATQIRDAAAAGFRVWSGYLATRARVGLATTWGQSDFDVARRCGAMPLAYCSGWDDPGSCRTLAAAWNVRLCLDVEGGIRGDGGWVQGWLDASGAGLYGNRGVHVGRRAPFYVLAGYPTSGDPTGASWDGSTRPAGPCGWQWAGTHSAFGCEVDSTWFDDWFMTDGGDVKLEADDPIVQEIRGQLGGSTQNGVLDLLRNVYNWTRPDYQHQTEVANALAALGSTQAQIKAELDTLKAGAGGVVDTSRIEGLIGTVDGHVEALRTHLGDPAP